ncbi:MAG: hypothetical protein ACREMY_15530, partial [bacterium]
MSRRPYAWGCRNHRVPKIKIFEVSLAESEPDGRLTAKEQLVGVIVNAFRGGFAEPQEHFQVTHVMPVDGSHSGVIGWRVLLTVEIP